MANVLIGIVAAIHVYILVLEMFLWDRPAGRKAFGLTPEFAQQTRTLAANQGLYNGFLAAGLFWGLFTGNRVFKIFFLACVLIAGLFGAVTASRKILYVQALPALAALLALLFRVNLPVAALVTLYSNPLTIGPLYWLAYKLGSLLTGGNGHTALPPLPSLSEHGLLGWLQHLAIWAWSLGLPLAVGLPCW